MWFSATDIGVTTKSESAIVIGMTGSPHLRRAYRHPSELGEVLNLADRIHAGDEILTGPGDRVELASGRNVLVAVGPESEVSLLGVRIVGSGSGNVASRLDVSVVTGAVRVQARLNTGHPETVFMTAPGIDVILERGDCGVSHGDSWRLVVVDGSVFVRLGETGGAPFQFEAGHSLGPGGPRPMAREDRDDFRARLAFGYEIVRAALPPNPPPNPDAEAP
jgi:hypothetical protein